MSHGIVAAILLCGPEAAEVPETVAGVDARCGAYCVYVALKGLDFPVPGFRDFEREIGQRERFGYSLQQLCDVSQRHGAYAVAGETDLATLEHVDEAFVWIALLNPHHFVLVADVGPNEVTLIDPPHRRQMRRGLFEHLWTGNALLISQNPLPDVFTRRRPLWPWAVGLALLAACALAACSGRVRRRLSAWRGAMSW